MVQTFSGKVVRTPGERHPYKAIIMSDGEIVGEQPASTVREAEALIRSHCGSGPAIPMDPLRAYQAPDPWVMTYCSRDLR